MFIALRRFTLVCTIVLERSLMHKQHDRATLGAVALMIGGMPPVKLYSLFLQFNCVMTIQQVGECSKCCT